MKALISPNEVLNFFDGTSGVRVCETHASGFEVAAPLFWVDCPDDLNPSLVYWNGEGFTTSPVPPEAPPVRAIGELPVTVTGE